MAGLPCDLKNIVKFCKEKKITLIEDCAHGLGSTFKKTHVYEILVLLAIFLFIQLSKLLLVKVEQ